MKIFNSLTRKLEEFTPLDSANVTIYVCGITPYDTTHLGHAFTYIFFDALIRYLKFKGFNVIYTQNVTDINDRDKDILERAKEQNVSWRKLSEFWTKKFLEDMQALNWTPPTNYLYASKKILSMIALIQKLLDKNLAYQVNGSIYLESSKFPDFGKLSKLNREKMIQTAKEFEEDLENPNKRNPLDITLWKSQTPNQPSHIPSFDSPFGQGRPGWHVECSAMSISSLGDQIDIHGGGIDLIFPHHEAEIVQSEGATGKIPFVKYWLHTGEVSYRGEKMSKSKGNLVMISDLLKKYSPNAIRWLLLSNHWSKNWEFKEEDLNKAQKDVNKIESAILLNTVHLESNNLTMDQFKKYMDNDLDTPKALFLILKLANSGNNPKGIMTIYSILGFKI